MGLFDKPRSVTINLDQLSLSDVEYYCTTKHIDKLVAKELKVDFNENFANEMEQQSRFYFIVKTNRQYDVVPGATFEKWVFDNVPALVIHDDWKNMPDYDPATGTGKIFVRVDESDDTYIQLTQMELTAKARACRDHFVAARVAEHKNKK